MSRNIMQVFHWNKMSVKPPIKSGQVLFTLFYCPNRVYSGYFNSQIRGEIFVQEPAPVVKRLDQLPFVRFSDILYWADAPVAPQED